MGLLDKLWDDTVAGPTPDTGLGKLRKSSPILPIVSDEVPISRSITIIKLNSNFRKFSTGGSGSVPFSPSGSSVPESPPSLESLMRRKSTSGALECVKPGSPTDYDWYSLTQKLYIHPTCCIPNFYDQIDCVSGPVIS